MFSREHTQQIYLELAESYDQQHEEALRDSFLMLAADTALRGNRPDEAERLRQRLLRSNPHHMLQAYLSFDEAARAPDVQAYLAELRMRYPPEIAQEMLETLLSPPGGGDDDFLGTLINPGPDDPPQTLPPQKRPPRPSPSGHTDFGEALGNEMEEGPGTLLPPPPAPAPAPQPPTSLPEDEPVVYRVHPELEQTMPPQAVPRPGKPAPVPPQNRSTPQTRLDVPRQPPPRNPAPAPPAPARPPEPRRQAAPPPRPAAKPAPAPAPTRPVAPARPAAPARAPARAPSSSPSLGPEEPAATGGMVSVVLFVIVLLSGLALALFALSPRPLL